jgi:hypothetical protein
MSNFSRYVRNKHYDLFVQFINPQKTDKIIDIGVSPDETLPDTNFFESLYPYKKKLSIASVENCIELVSKYGLKTFYPINADKKLPFKDNQFDIVVSFATLEHVGDVQKQRRFLNELFRIGKKVFITTPDRAALYEPHTATFFLHWLPPALFRRIVYLMGKKFWSQEDHLHILSYRELKGMVPLPYVYVERYKLFSVFYSHLIIHGKTS